MARTRQKLMGRKLVGNFLPIPAVVMNCPNFRAMSRKAKALILDMGGQYNGNNNGDIAAPWSWMRVRGWPSKQTLERALDELQRFGMIELTRQGGLHGPNLYAFTWIEIHPCKGRLDVGPSDRPSGKWKHPPTPLAA